MVAEPLGPGLWRVRSAGRSYAVRFLRRSAVHGLDPRAVVAASGAAGAAGLGPRVRHVDDPERPLAMVLDFVEGTMPSQVDLGSEDGLKRVVGLLAKVSALVLPSDVSLPDRSLAATLRRYQHGLADTSWAPRAAAWQSLVDRALAAEQACPAGQTFVHGDVHAGNLVCDGTRLWLIDWEYAGYADPLLDLASLAVNAVPALWRQLLAARLAPPMMEGQDDDGLKKNQTSKAARPSEPQDGGPSEILATRFAGLMLGAALRDLFWGYAQSQVDAELPSPDYLATNEHRVDTLTTWLTDLPGDTRGPAFH